MVEVKHYRKEEMDSILQQKGTLEYQDLLEHIAICNRCSATFAMYIEESSLYHASVSLKASIKDEIKFLSVSKKQEMEASRKSQKPELKVVQGGRPQMQYAGSQSGSQYMGKRQFVIYSTKVVLAAGIAIAMLFGMDLNSVKKTPEAATTMEQLREESVKKEQKNSMSDVINQSLGVISDFFEGAVTYGKNQGK